MDSIKPRTSEAELLKCIDFMQTHGSEIPIEVILLNASFSFIFFPVSGRVHWQQSCTVHHTFTLLFF